MVTSRDSVQTNGSFVQVVCCRRDFCGHSFEPFLSPIFLVHTCTFLVPVLDHCFGQRCLYHCLFRSSLPTTTFQDLLKVRAVQYRQKTASFFKEGSFLDSRQILSTASKFRSHTIRLTPLFWLRLQLFKVLLAASGKLEVNAEFHVL